MAGSTDGLDRYAQTALDRECGSIRTAPQGKRQDALNRGAYSVAQLVAAGALPAGVARGAVMAAALANPGNDDARAIEATHVFAKELRGRDITVNAVAPGPTATKLFLDGKDQKTVDTIAGMAPLGRLGEPEDIASVVAFLVGPDGGWVNGQILRANDGVI